MFRAILVPIDGSQSASQALDQAIHLAVEQGAVMRIVHVADTFTLSYDMEFVDIAEIRRSLRKAGEGLLEKAREQAQAAGVEADTRLVEIQEPGQRIADVITEEARSWPADLIVIGTHGRRGLDHFLLGSVAEAVTRIALVPVLLIRGKKD
jgi:nucleotide-binding universal stress UspA family protein